jgi:hypothetical protein
MHHGDIFGQFVLKGNAPIMDNLRAHGRKKPLFKKSGAKTFC